MKLKGRLGIFMINKREKIQYAYVFVFDTIAIILSVIGAVFITDTILERIEPYGLNDWVQTLTFVGIAFILTFFCFNQSENIVTRSFKKELKLQIKFNILMAAIYQTLMLLTKAQMITSRYFAVAVPIINVGAIVIQHTILKTFLVKVIAKRRMESLVGVITIKDEAESLINELNIDWSKKVCGIAVLDASDSEIGTKICNINIEANYENFMNWLRTEALDEIYIDIPMDSGEQFMPYLEEMESMGLTVHFHLKILDQIEKQCCGETSVARLSNEISKYAGNNFVTMGTVEIQLKDLLLKRVMDICGALIGCVISIPIIAIVAIPLKLESPGKLIFKQKRVGLNGRYFYIHKLRSMYTDAEERKKELMAKNEMTGNMFKIKDDPRITKVGKFIRKTSIDELPQFFDVLMGNMSLVGTRPPTVDEYKQYESHHKRRLSMKPGITGLWQISGRNNIDNFEDVVKLDVKYIDNWQIWLDFKIILKTIVVVFKGRGAR